MIRGTVEFQLVGGSQKQPGVWHIVSQKETTPPTDALRNDITTFGVGHHFAFLAKLCGFKSYMLSQTQRRSSVAS